jgi:hypothetical protein
VRGAQGLLESEKGGLESQFQSLLLPTVNPGRVTNQNSLATGEISVNAIADRPERNEGKTIETLSRNSPDEGGLKGGEKDNEAFGQPQNVPCMIYECIISSGCPRLAISHRVPRLTMLSLQDLILHICKIFKRRKTKVSAEDYLFSL